MASRGYLIYCLTLLLCSSVSAYTNTINTELYFSSVSYNANSLLTFVHTNNLPGVTFDNINISKDVVDDLFTQICSLNPSYNKNDLYNMMAGQLPITSGSDVKKGYTITLNPDGSIESSNNGMIPGLTNDIWDAGECLIYGISFPNIIFDLDGNGILDDITININALEPHINGIIVTTTDGIECSGNISTIEATFSTDYNKDGFVNLLDFALLTKNWLTDYNIDDLLRLTSQWLNTNR